MEFLLLNHPVDCAICDQAGECKLQDCYQRHDHRSSRLEGEDPQGQAQRCSGPLVVLDQERCVLCTRCVRFMTEVPKETQLGVFNRGSAELIDTFPGKELDSSYSGNVVDICPVGALLNRDFRFRARSWFLSAAPSVCTGCSRGCSTFVDFMGQDTYRYRPRENEQINKSWMCDQGPALLQVRQPRAAGGADARPRRGPARGRRPGVDLGGQRPVQGARRHRGPGGAGLSRRLQPGPARLAGLRPRRAGHPLRSTWAVARRERAITS